MTTTTYAAMDTTIVDRAQALLAGAEQYTIDSDLMFECAGEDLKAVKALAKTVETDRKALTKPLDEQKKKIMDHYRPAETYLVQAESILKKAIGRYTDEQARQRQAAQIAAAKVTDDARAQLTTQATAAAAAGQVNHAAMLHEAAAITTVAVPTIATPKVTGLSSRKKFTGKVCNQQQLIQHILANPALLAMGIVTIDQGALNKYIQATKGEAVLPGVVIESETVVASRAA